MRKRGRGKVKREERVRTRGARNKEPEGRRRSKYHGGLIQEGSDQFQPVGSACKQSLRRGGDEIARLTLFWRGVRCLYAGGGSEVRIQDRDYSREHRTRKEGAEEGGRGRGGGRGGERD
eukprot:746435-Hanusia_phi.AAC.2